MMKKTFFPLFALLALPLTSCIAFSITVRFNDYSYEGSSGYSEYVAPLVFDSASIGSLKIGWVVGDISVAPGDRLTVMEEATKGTYLPLYYRVDSGELSVQFCKSGTSGSKFDGLSKKLRITIPDTLKNIDLDLVSVSYSVEGRNLKQLNVNSVNGNGSVRATTIENMNLKSVAGAFSFTCADSANLNAIDIDTVSGDASLYLDGKRGYNISFATVSGQKALGFTDGSDPDLSRFYISFNSVSGNLSVQKFAE